MTLTVEAYAEGQTTRIYARIESENVLADPTEITIMHRDPSGNEASEIYNAGAGNVVKLSAGVYYLDVDLDEAGTWAIRVKTTGIVAATEKQINVTASYFDTP